MFSISIYMVCKMYLKMRSFSYLVIMIRRIGARVRVAFRQSCSSGNSGAGLVSAMAATDDVFFSRCGFRCRSFLLDDCIVSLWNDSGWRAVWGGGRWLITLITYIDFVFTFTVLCLIYIYLLIYYIYIKWKKRHNPYEYIIL